MTGRDTGSASRTTRSMMTIPVGTLRPPAVSVERPVGLNVMATALESQRSGRHDHYSRPAAGVNGLGWPLAKHKRMHPVTIDECDSVPLAHKTAESDRSRKHRSRKGSVSPFSPNETTLEASYSDKSEMQREDSTCLHDRKGPECKTSGGGASMCIHGLQKSKCKACGGVGICIHGRKKSICKECGGGSICIHGRQKSR